ncbi:MAG TPA: class I tRNA ligase family protein [Gemmatimonadota bacterium]|nr:class I tRNA ligase family protein [Gemmatimonadota bacterium]
MSRYYLTTPIYYVNDRPHIGHAYTTILADVLARRRRVLGDDVRFLTGTDEHGQKSARAAAGRGLDPQAHVDEMAKTWKANWDALEIRYDRFIRTTDSDHRAVVQSALGRLKAGTTPDGEPLLYESAYVGWYCVSDERYWTDRDVADGRCPECGRAVEQIEERNWFFRMSAFQTALIRRIESNPGFIQPASRANEVLGFLREPLGDLCISRPRERLPWGIPFPWDDSYVTYVWVDALLNYVTGTVDPAPGESPAETADRAIAAWNAHPADVHLIGKDILTTHSVYWTTLLMALGWELPRSILAHGWWLWEGGKMSKSVGNVVRPDDLVPDFGVDGLRYYLLREMVLGQDSTYSYESIVHRLNSDLANDFGNLLSRVTRMVERYLEGRLPSRAEVAGIAADEAVLADLARILTGGREVPGSVAEAWEAWRIHVALERVMALVGAANEYLERRQPWKRIQAEGGALEVAATLLQAAEAVRLAAALLWPVAPELAARALGSLGRPAAPGADDLRWGVLDGERVEPGAPLYARLEPAGA